MSKRSSTSMATAAFVTLTAGGFFVLFLALMKGSEQPVPKSLKAKQVVVDVKTTRAEALVAEASGAIVMPVTESTDTVGTLLWPTRVTRLSSDFGFRMNPLTGEGHQLHAGVDVPVAVGTEVVAVEDGVVTFAGWSESAGFMITLSHEGGWSTRYMHLSKARARTGEKVVAGETIAYSGNTGALTTGAHLHFEIWNGASPMNPMAFRYRHLPGGSSIVATLEAKPTSTPSSAQFSAMRGAMVRH